MSRVLCSCTVGDSKSEKDTSRTTMKLSPLFFLAWVGTASAFSAVPPPGSQPPPPPGAEAPPGGPGAARAPSRSGSQPGGNPQHVRDIWDTLSPQIVQGDTLRTWSFPDAAIDRLQVHMKTEGRPLNANVELWQGPDNTPQTMGIFLEDGAQRPFAAVVLTPRGSNAIALRNTSPQEFPLSACVEADNGSSGLGAMIQSLSDREGRIVQGGSIWTTPFAPSVASVQVLLKTDGRPMTARIELLQGPNNIKQSIDLYSEDGQERPFFAVIQSPETGNVVRIVNTATIEYPLVACVEPYMEEVRGGAPGSVGTWTN